MDTWQRYAAVAAGGAAGSCLRFAVANWVPQDAAARFPWATLAVNVTGCSLLGAVLAVVPGGADADPRWRLLLGVGLCGGFTTFSAFAAETTALLAGRQFATAAVNVAGSVVAGLLAFRAGHWVAERLAGGAL